MNIRHYIWTLIIALTSAVVLFYCISKYTSKVFSDYPMVKKNASINTTVYKVKQYKATTLILDQNGVGISLRAFNEDLEKTVLAQHVNEGDSIVKKPHSDSLILFKRNPSHQITFHLDFLKYKK